MICLRSKWAGLFLKLRQEVVSFFFSSSQPTQSWSSSVWTLGSPAICAPGSWWSSMDRAWVRHWGQSSSGVLEDTSLVSGVQQDPLISELNSVWLVSVSCGGSWLYTCSICSKIVKTGTIWPKTSFARQAFLSRLVGALDGSTVLLLCCLNVSVAAMVCTELFGFW